MPRYFFHLVKGSAIVVRDETGYECPDDQAARRYAQHGDGLVVVRDCASGSLKQHNLQVANEAGNVIFTIPLSELRAA